MTSANSIRYRMILERGDGIMQKFDHMESLAKGLAQRGIAATEQKALIKELRAYKTFVANVDLYHINDNGHPHHDMAPENLNELILLLEDLDKALELGIEIFEEDPEDMAQELDELKAAGHEVKLSGAPTSVCVKNITVAMKRLLNFSSEHLDAAS
ncbi:hypothetical protein BJX76DRAFT_357052 [Aspergillus varians]